MKLRLCVFLISCLLCLPGLVLGQSGTVTAGRSYNISSAQWSYSLGQPLHLGLGSVNQTQINQGIQQTYPNKITGLVRYDNAASTPLNNCSVQLKDAQSSVITSAISSASGAYVISSFPNGTYNLSATSTKPWGGVNGTDALLISLHAVGISPLSGMRLAVGDVNMSSVINSSDALMIRLRFASLITSFPSGDWYFQRPVVTANGQPQNVNLKGLTYGDVNGSYIPSNARQSVRLNMAYDGVRYDKSDSELWLPIYADRSLEIGAISVVAGCPEGLEVVDVRSSLNHEDLSWNYQNGEFRLVWSKVSGRFVDQDEPLFEIRVKGNSEKPWLMDGLSEIADMNAVPYDMVQLRIPKVLPSSQGWHASIYPNPANTEAYFDLDLPAGTDYVKLELLDSRGRVVWMDDLSSPTAGRLLHQIPTRILSEGRYLARVQAKISKEPFLVTKNLPLIIRR